MMRLLFRVREREHAAASDEHPSQLHWQWTRNILSREYHASALTGSMRLLFRVRERELEHAAVICPPRLRKVTSSGSRNLPVAQPGTVRCHAIGVTRSVFRQWTLVVDVPVIVPWHQSLGRHRPKSPSHCPPSPRPSRHPPSAGPWQPELKKEGGGRPESAFEGLKGNIQPTRSCTHIAGYPRFPDLRPIGTPIPVSRPKRETARFPIPDSGTGPSGIGSSLPVSRPNRESGERELGISGSEGLPLRLRRPANSESLRQGGLQCHYKPRTVPSPRTGVTLGNSLSRTLARACQKIRPPLGP
jgi:hypothetical protein